MGTPEDPETRGPNLRACHPHDYGTPGAERQGCRWGGVTHPSDGLRPGNVGGLILALRAIFQRFHGPPSRRQYLLEFRLGRQVAPEPLQQPVGEADLTP